MSLFRRLAALASPRAQLTEALRLLEAGKGKRALALLARAAEAGLAEAQYRLGRLYLENKVVPFSPVEAARWLIQASEQGHAEAQVTLATLYLQGLAPKTAPKAGATDTLFNKASATLAPDFEKALELARRAAESGAAEGQALLGYILTFGPESMRDLAAAEEWYRKSAAAGCPQGRLGYAMALLRQGQKPETLQEAREQLRLAAEAELPTAHYLLGMMAEQGVGMARDLAAAAEHYRIAAERGLRPAQARWGLALLEGRGVERNTISILAAASSLPITLRLPCGFAAPPKRDIARRRARWG